MKVCAVYLTFPRDYALAEVSMQSVPADWDIFWVLESDDARFLKVPSRVRVIEKDFNRGGNLRGVDACRQIYSLLATLAERYDKVVKIDSDTLLFQPGEMVKDYSFFGVNLVNHDYTFHGCAYTVTAPAMRHALANFDKAVPPMGWVEDEALGFLLRDFPGGRIVSNRYAFWLTNLPAPVPCLEHIYGHYGWRLAVGKDMKKALPVMREHLALLQTVRQKMRPVV